MLYKPTSMGKNYLAENFCSPDIGNIAVIRWAYTIYRERSYLENCWKYNICMFYRFSGCFS